MKQPDAFERIVLKACRSDEEVGYNAFLFPIDALKLLRAHHRRVVALVKRQGRWNPGEVLNGKVVMRIESGGHFIQIDDLLSALKKIERGTP